MDINTMFSLALSFAVVLFLAWKVGSPLLGPSEMIASLDSQDDARKRSSRDRIVSDSEELREDYASGKISSEEFQKNETRLLKTGTN